MTRPHWGISHFSAWPSETRPHFLFKHYEDTPFVETQTSCVYFVLFRFSFPVTRARVFGWWWWLWWWWRRRRWRTRARGRRGWLTREPLWSALLRALLWHAVSMETALVGAVRLKRVGCCCCCCWAARAKRRFSALKIHNNNGLCLFFIFTVGKNVKLVARHSYLDARLRWLVVAWRSSLN